MSREATQQNDGGSAFPCYVPNGHSDKFGIGGMSLRDYFAIHANSDVVESIAGSTIKDVAKFLGMDDAALYMPAVHWPAAETKARYIYADMMLKARNE